MINVQQVDAILKSEGIIGKRLSDSVVFFRSGNSKYLLHIDNEDGDMTHIHIRVRYVEDDMDPLSQLQLANELNDKVKSIKITHDFSDNATQISAEFWVISETDLHIYFRRYYNALNVTILRYLMKH